MTIKLPTTNGAALDGSYKELTSNTSKIIYAPDNELAINWVSHSG